MGVAQCLPRKHMKNQLRNATALLGAVVLATSSLAAQTFTVGPGKQFSTIAIATLVVPSGSVLIVDPGPYGPFSVVNKSVSIVCAQQGQRMSIISTAADPAFSVSGVPNGEVCLISDVDVSWANQVQPAIEAINNAGDLFLDRITVQASQAHLAATVGGAVSIENCDVTWMTECLVNANNDFPACRTTGIPADATDLGVPAVWVSQSDLVVDRSNLRGFNYPEPAGRGGAAIRTQGAGVNVRIFGPEGRPFRLRGGDGGLYGGDVLQHLTPSQPSAEKCAYGQLIPGVGAAGTGGEFAINADRGLAGGLQRIIPACILEAAAQTYNANIDGFVQIGGTLTMGLWCQTSRTAWLYLDTSLDLSTTVPGGVPGISMLGWTGAALLSGPFFMAGGTSTQSFAIPFDPNLYGYRFGVQLISAPTNGAPPVVVSPGDLVVVQ